MNANDTVVVTSRSFGSGTFEGRAELERAGLRVTQAGADHDLGAIGEDLRDAVAWIAGTGPVTRAHLAAAPHLRVVARYGVGVDAVDLDAAVERGILVTNTPGANAGAVADHTIGLMLDLLRHISAGDRAVRQGDWTPLRGRELGSVVVGIVGLGRIGRGVAERLRGFGAATVAHDPWLPSGRISQLKVTPLGLADLAGRCDIVTLHASGSDPIITAEWLELAHPGLLLINTARAGLVDEVAVARAITSGRVAGYAADTIGSEFGDPSSNPLLARELSHATVFTPHSAAQTVQAIDAMGRIAVDAVLTTLAGGIPETVVALPVKRG